MEQKSKKKVMDELATKLIEIQTSGRLATISYLRIVEEMHKHIQNHKALANDAPASIITGSIAEGMSFGVCNDYDQMTLMSDSEVYWEPPKSVMVCDDEYFLLVAEHINESVYVKLKVCFKNVVPEKYQQMINENGYLRSSKFMEYKLKMASGPRQSKIQGPALAGVSSNNTDMDTVPSWKCNSWPKITNDFFKRDKPNNWPSSELLKKVSKEDCFVVAVGRSGSSSKDIEWRLSFSLAEKLLIQEMCPAYASCNATLKAVKNEFIVFDLPSNAPTPFCSYFIKTACLWTCETGPVIENSIMDIMRQVLDWLIQCYHKRNLPHYFVPEHNLIGHLSKEACEEVQKKLSEIKNNIWWMVMTNISLGNFNTKQFVRNYIDSDTLKYKVEENPYFEYEILEKLLLENPIAMRDIKLELAGNLRILEPGFKTISIVLILRNDSGHLTDYLLKQIQRNTDPLEVLKMPEEIIGHVIENMKEIGVIGYTDMFMTRLHHYLGDLYTFLLILLQSKYPKKSFNAYMSKPIDYYTKGAEMVWPDGWSDHGIGGLSLVVKHQYQMGIDVGLRSALNEFRRVLDSEDRNYFTNRLPGIHLRSNGILSSVEWRTDALLLHRILTDNTIYFFHPIALVFYIEARLLLREGNIGAASEIMSELKSFPFGNFKYNDNKRKLQTILINEGKTDEAVRVENEIKMNESLYTQNESLITIVEGIIGLLKVAGEILQNCCD